MKQIFIWVFVVSFIFIHKSESAEVDAVEALVGFFENISANFSQSGPVSGWNRTSDPCQSNWTGIVCYDQTLSVKSITLNSLNLSGTFNPGFICNMPFLANNIVLISIINNNLRGENFEAVSNCRKLTHLFLSKNRFSGDLPDSLSHLNNLKRLELSNNGFSGSLPNLARISGLIEFVAENNQFSGPIPEFDFPNFSIFNVSNNDLSGPIPPGGDLFSDSSYLGNPQLCGDPLPNRCETGGTGTGQLGVNGSKSNPAAILMYFGYFVVGFALFLVIMLKLCNSGKKREEVLEKGDEYVSKEHGNDDDTTKNTFTSSEFKSKSEVFAGNSMESAPVSCSLIVLTSPEVNGLKFEELLKAPAELLGRGKHGSVYKVKCEEQQGMTLAVKRVKDWSLASNDFKVRMRRLDQVKHHNVLPVVAFYCSRQEKLLVYEYQPNGSLFKLLHGMPMGQTQTFDWSSRLGVASTVANALAVMHDELRGDGIPHGNLKSSNILFNANMEPMVSEYGLMMDESPDDNSFQSNIDQESAFRADIRALGVILLELLTGKMPLVRNNGMDLATWVVSVVKEEWTVEVFDRALIREGASEERMVNLLQIAIKCVDRTLDPKLSINQIATMISNIKEEDERSVDVSESPFDMRN